MKIVVKKGLNIPLSGKPEGSLQHLPRAPSRIALNLASFDSIRFKIHTKVGERVKIGTPLVESKIIEGQMFVSPASGVVTEIRRGIKRRLMDIVIEVDESENYEKHEALDIKKSSKDEILNFFMRTGLFPHLCMRPFNLIANPKFLPRDIFVTALETRPFAVPFERQVEGHENYFQAGLDALAKLTKGRVHLIFEDKCRFKAFTHAEHVEKHEALGPHPASSSSLHIHNISPIRHPEDYVWSLTALDALIIGKMIVEGRYFTDRIISIGGNGVLEDRRGFFFARMGYPIKDLIADRISDQPMRLISGDPLTGAQVEPSDFLYFAHTSFCAIPENVKRESFHFLRLGLHKFTATRSYLTGFVKPPKNGYAFTTNQHGEKRAFVDGSVYERVMPMRLPTMFLIKAILAEDFELAQQLGLLEVVPEDFALASFICPSKIEMVEIVKQGLHTYAKEMGH